jgi:putative transposase
MFQVVLFFIKNILKMLITRNKDIITEYLTLKKENEILQRKLSSLNKKPQFTQKDRFFFAFIFRLSDKFRAIVSLVKPETILKWYRNIIKRHWTFDNKKKKPGRPSTPESIKKLVLKIKNENIFFGYKKIKGELEKLGIILDKTTIRNILLDYRKKGKVKTGTLWKNFIKSHLESLYCMDFFTLDTIFGKRFYIWFIMYIKTRVIVHFRTTTNPTKLFVEQQLMHVTYDMIENDERMRLIHDNSPQFKHLWYESYNIDNVPISVMAPNMNAYAERFVRSIRKECFDWFILFNEKQVRKLLSEYISYYNSKRSHQGIDYKIPKGYMPQTKGIVVSKPVLFGLIHHYERLAA